MKNTTLSLAQNVLLNICVQALKNKVTIPPGAQIKKLHGEWLGYSSFSLGFDLKVIFKSYSDKLELVRIGTPNQLYNHI